MDVGLRDAHVLVTGASGGIGLATSKVFLDAGSIVSMHYNSNRKPIDSFKATNASDRINDVQANLRNESEVIRMFEALKSPVEVLVVNHGVWENASVPLADMSLDQWNFTMSTNLTSSFLVIREYLKHLRNAPQASKDRAAIVLIGSSSGIFGEHNHADYSASKAAMMYGLTLTLKNEIVKIAPKGRVNCIAPAWVKTPMAEEALKDQAVVYESLATTPLKRFATSEDVAYQVLVYSSPVLSRHVTGEIIVVSGGMEGRLLNEKEDINMNDV